ncbi:hypothetical protein [Frigoribacterium sp. CFBP 13712]|uniref:hypothetical protein n=1 Tax=Frigoribacterium sp. CFBP 13712 TaxID=2775309 RepID=UPI00177F95FF|nr:hypothetical protein [Frigoribacterium sp. CFBP 13712]MBD8704717.1 hypothetical protein [Frigoribacterium sp. CFBP 13712]
MTDEATGRDADDAERDSADWLAAQFGGPEPEPEPDDTEQPEPVPEAAAAPVTEPSEPELQIRPAMSPTPATDPEPSSPSAVAASVPVVPVVPRRAPSLPVPPAPTDESTVSRSSGHPMALDLAALRRAASAEPTPTEPPSDASEAAADEREAPAVPSREQQPPHETPAPASSPAPSAPADPPRSPSTDEPGPFTAILTTPTASDLAAEPRTFDWSALPSEPEPEPEPGPEPEPVPEPHLEDDLPPTQAHDIVTSDVETRAFTLPADDRPEEERVVDHAPPVVDPPEPAPLNETRALPVSEAPSGTPPEPEAEAAPEPEPAAEPAPEAEAEAEPAPEPEPARDPTPEPEPEPARDPTPEPEPEPEPASRPESVQTPGRDSDAAPVGATTPAAASSADPWWVEEHHEMTRRERRLAEAAGQLPPPAVAPAATAPEPAPRDAAGDPSPSDRDDEYEPTFTEILGIVRQPVAEPDSAETLPAGSWSLSDEVDPVDSDDSESAARRGAHDPSERGQHDVVDDEPADDAATSVLPRRARSTPSDAPFVPLFGDDDEPGPRRRGSAAPEPESDPFAGFSAPSGSSAPIDEPGPRRRGDETRPRRTSSGGGIETWPRERKILLGVAAGVVVVLALLVLFLLVGSAFAAPEAASTGGPAVLAAVASDAMMRPEAVVSALL